MKDGCIAKYGRGLFDPGPFSTIIRSKGNGRTIHVVSEQERGTWEKRGGNSRKRYIKAPGLHGGHGDEQAINEAIDSAGYEVR